MTVIGYEENNQLYFQCVGCQKRAFVVSAVIIGVIGYTNTVLKYIDAVLLTANGPLFFRTLSLCFSFISIDEFKSFFGSSAI